MTHCKNKSIRDLCTGIYGFKKCYYHHRFNLVKDENGNPSANSYDILSQWKNYFHQLLNMVVSIVTMLVLFSTQGSFTAEFHGIFIISHNMKLHVPAYNSGDEDSCCVNVGYFLFIIISTMVSEPTWPPVQ